MTLPWPQPWPYALPPRIHRFSSGSPFFRKSIRKNIFYWIKGQNVTFFSLFFFKSSYTIFFSLSLYMQIFVTLTLTPNPNFRTPRSIPRKTQLTRAPGVYSPQNTACLNPSPQITSRYSIDSIHFFEKRRKIQQAPPISTLTLIYTYPITPIKSQSNRIL